MARLKNLKPAHWYIPHHGNDKPRWILAIDRPDHAHMREATVVYSKGGSRHYHCRRSSFLAWIRRVRAHCARRYVSRVLELK